MPGRSSALNDTTIGLLRSKSGCKTCKIRRVKCGEEKPHCVRCTSTGRKCEYDGRKPSRFSIVSTQPVLANSLSLSPNTMWRERRAFAYYFQNAASAVGGGLDVDFWRTIVPQVCRSEPAVWDAIISVSALFESPEPISDPDLTQNHRDALGWYSRSVSAVRQQIERGSVDTFVGLISCVLFICIEALQGGVDEAIQLYCQGVHLIMALRTQIASGLVTAAKAALLEDTIVPIFIRLGLIGFTFSRPQIGLLLRGVKRKPRQIFSFVSLRSAREDITRLGTEIQFFQHSCGEYLLNPDDSRIPQDLLDLQADLSVQLRDWHSAFMNLVDSLSLHGTVAMTSEDTGTIALFSAIYESLFIMLEVSASSSEVITDAFLPNFQRIVEQSRIALDASMRSDGTQPPFTFDINPGVALWFTCLRCRDPTIRRESLALMLRSPRVQGFYSCMSAVYFGERIMLLEEMNGEVMRANPETEHFSTTESLIGYQYSPSPSPSLSPRSADYVDTPSTYSIPEEARIGHFDVFQPKRGLPPDITEEVMTKWNLRRDRTFLGFWRNERDEGSDTWRMVREYIPMDMKY